MFNYNNNFVSFNVELQEYFMDMTEITRKIIRLE